jgi:hypothetical protein
MKEQIELEKNLPLRKSRSSIIDPNISKKATHSPKPSQFVQQPTFSEAVKSPKNYVATATLNLNTYQKQRSIEMQPESVSLRSAKDKWNKKIASIVNDDEKQNSLSPMKRLPSLSNTLTVSSP